MLRDLLGLLIGLSLLLISQQLKEQILQESDPTLSSQLFRTDPSQRIL